MQTKAKLACLALGVLAALGLIAWLYMEVARSGLQRSPAEVAQARKAGTRLWEANVAVALERYRARYGAYPPTDRPFGSVPENVFYHLTRPGSGTGLDLAVIERREPRGALKSPGYVHPVFADGYRRPYAYKFPTGAAPSDDVEIISAGKDGVFGTTDDVVFRSSEARSDGLPPGREGRSGARRN